MDELHHRLDASEALTSWSRGNSRGVPCYTSAALDYSLIKELEQLDDPSSPRAAEIRAALGTETLIFRGVANPTDPETPLLEREIRRALEVSRAPMTTAHLTDVISGVLDLPGGVTKQKIFSVLRLMVKQKTAQRSFQPTAPGARRVGRWTLL